MGSCATSGVEVVCSDGTMSTDASHVELDCAVTDRNASRHRLPTPLDAYAAVQPASAVMISPFTCLDLSEARNRASAAIVPLLDALAIADACAAPYELALTLIPLAEAMIAAGDREEANTALIEAQAICAELGALPALPHIDRVTARLAELERPAADHPEAAVNWGPEPHLRSILPVFMDQIGVQSPRLIRQIFLECCQAWKKFDVQEIIGRQRPTEPDHLNVGRLHHVKTDLSHLGSVGNDLGIAEQRGAIAVARTGR